MFQPVLAEQVAVPGSMTDALLTALKEASRGLLYPSETDAEFEPFRWPGGTKGLTPTRVAALAGGRALRKCRSRTSSAS